MKILFVCTGNTCRSPMAEAVFNSIAEKSGSEHKAFSRGTSVFFSEPVNKKALAALEKINITGFEHSSAQINEEDVCSADIVLTMTSQHKMALKNAFPKYSDRIFTLNEKAYGKDSPVSDPFGQSAQVYEQCAKEIESAVRAVFEKL